MIQKPILQDKDIDLAPILERNVAIIGYGNQGRPQALNLRDSGVRVKVGARANSLRREVAERDGFAVLPMADAIAWADVVMLLLPDEAIPEVYEDDIAPYLKTGQTLGFGHGLAIHAGWIHPALHLNVFLVAPKAQGRGVRNKFTHGSGVPGLYAVYRNPSGETDKIALAYAKAIGCGRVGVMPTTFAEETICDLFSEQAVLCGGLTSMIKAAFETLLEAGFSHEVAYFECLYEVKLIADLLHEKGINGMRAGISSTALYGDISRGRRVIDAHVKENMRRVLGDILSGHFAHAMRQEFEHGKPEIREQMARDEHHPIERTHRDLHRRLKF